MVEFVSYDGKYPNLCHGTFIVKIDGKQYKFGWEEECDALRFWETGGDV